MFDQSDVVEQRAPIRNRSFNNQFKVNRSVACIFKDALFVPLSKERSKQKDAHQQHHAQHVHILQEHIATLVPPRSSGRPKSSYRIQ